MEACKEEKRSNKERNMAPAFKELTIRADPEVRGAGHRGVVTELPVLGYRDRKGDINVNSVENLWRIMEARTFQRTTGKQRILENVLRPSGR